MKLSEFKEKLPALAEQLVVLRDLISLHATAKLKLEESEKLEPTEDIRSRISIHSESMGTYQVTEIVKRKELLDLLSDDYGHEDREEFEEFLKENFKIFELVSGASDEPYYMCDIEADGGETFKYYWSELIKTYVANVRWFIHYRAFPATDPNVVVEQRKAVFALDTLCEKFPEYKETFLGNDSYFETFYNRIKREEQCQQLTQ